MEVEMDQSEEEKSNDSSYDHDQHRRRKRSADWLGFTSYTTKKPRSVNTYSFTTRKPSPSYFHSSYTTQKARPSYSSFTTKNPRPSSTNNYGYSSYTKQNTAKSISATVKPESPVVYRRPAAQFYGYQPYQPHTKQVYTTQIPATVQATSTKPAVGYRSPTTTKPTVVYRSPTTKPTVVYRSPTKPVASYKEDESEVVQTPDEPVVYRRPVAVRYGYMAAPKQVQEITPDSSATENPIPTATKSSPIETPSVYRRPAAEFYGHLPYNKPVTVPVQKPSAQATDTAKPAVSEVYRRPAKDEFESIIRNLKSKIEIMSLRSQQKDEEIAKLKIQRENQAKIIKELTTQSTRIGPVEDQKSNTRNGGYSNQVAVTTPGSSEATTQSTTTERPVEYSNPVAIIGGYTPYSKSVTVTTQSSSSTPKSVTTDNPVVYQKPTAAIGGYVPYSKPYGFSSTTKLSTTVTMPQSASPASTTTPQSTSPASATTSPQLTTTSSS